MSFVFKPAKKGNVALLIGLAGGTGSGKTYSAMEIATGMSGGKPFAVIDTENGRALHYADEFNFNHGKLEPPFTPGRYTDAIKAAAGYPVVVVDSGSHIYAGEGGILDMQGEELQRMAGDDYRKRDSCLMASWIKPKMEHKKFVQQLLQQNSHVIFCMRAEPKVEMKKQNGRLVVVPKESPVGAQGWIPICEKNLPFEMTLSFLLLSENPGVPVPIKLQKQHLPIFDNHKQLNREQGELLIEWAGKSGKQNDTATLKNDITPQMKATYDELSKKATMLDIDHKPIEEIKTATELKQLGNELFTKIEELKVEGRNNDF